MFPEFEGTSYAARYELLCRKLVQEGLYDAAALLLSSRQEGRKGDYLELSPFSGMKRLVTALAGRVATAAAMP